MIFLFAFSLSINDHYIKRTASYFCVKKILAFGMTSGWVNNDWNFISLLKSLVHNKIISCTLLDTLNRIYPKFNTQMVSYCSIASITFVWLQHPPIFSSTISKSEESSQIFATSVCTSIRCTRPFHFILMKEDTTLQFLFVQTVRMH